MAATWFTLGLSALLLRVNCANVAGVPELYLKCPDTWVEGRNETITCTVKTSAIGVENCQFHSDDVRLYRTLNGPETEYGHINITNCSQNYNDRGFLCKKDNDSISVIARVTGDKRFEGASWGCKVVCLRDSKNPVTNGESESCQNSRFEGEGGKTLSGGEIAGIVFGVVLAILVIAAIAVKKYGCCCKKFSGPKT